jgi:hypothetical protein
MLMVVGPRRSGNGTIGRVLRRLAGSGTWPARTTSSLAWPFGLQPLLGKSLAVVSDARFTGDDVAVYEQGDAAYRSRLHASLTAAAPACASIQREIDVLTPLHMVRDVVGLFRDRAADVAEQASICGWGAAMGRGRDGRPRGGRGSRGGAGRSAGRRRVAAGRGREGGHARGGAAESGDPAERVEGFGRFSRECCGVEPLVLTRAWRLVTDDPAAEALKLDPEAEVDEALATAWHRNLTGPWAKHADRY